MRLVTGGKGAAVATVIVLGLGGGVAARGENAEVSAIFGALGEAQDAVHRKHLAAYAGRLEAIVGGDDIDAAAKAFIEVERRRVEGEIEAIDDGLDPGGHRGWFPMTTYAPVSEAWRALVPARREGLEAAVEAARAELRAHLKRCFAENDIDGALTASLALERLATARVRPKAEALPVETNPWREAALEFVIGSDEEEAGVVIRSKGKHFAAISLHGLVGRMAEMDLRAALEVRLSDGGGEVRPEAGYILVDPEGLLALIPIGSSRFGLTVPTDGETVVSVGDPIAVSTGSKIQTGAVRAVGPHLIEVDEALADGSAGQAVVDVETGDLLAVLAYRVEIDVDRVLRRDREGDIESRRWFARRMDNLMGWERVPLQDLAVQARRLKDAADLSIALVREIFRGGTGSYAGKTHPAIVEARGRVAQQFDRFGRSRGSGRRRPGEVYINELIVVATSDLRYFPARPCCDFIRREFAFQRKFRKLIAGALREANE